MNPASPGAHEGAVSPVDGSGAVALRDVLGARTSRSTAVPWPDASRL
ncbi:MAG: hypothetical protein JRM86_03105 [Nitrososphaerota archaeon]|nr:hypothetical protein [Nitrososphaerota archaeon]MDG6967752.1 hypothetical protein [Nitrososphaerota archaeon]MDG6977876.1 hypothetical protein [Nitrososphaerota archaeon]MDG7005903.1 hypothetical protein [Nitrososphaerota archaeon]MDG7021758.1 hypothetical protein [Nitrososphaerota archaeon]